MIFLLLLLATPIWAGTLPALYEASCDVHRGSASAALCVALDATVSLKLQANLDTQLTAIDDYVDTEITAIKNVTDQFVAAQSEPTSVPAANATPLQKIAWIAALARNKITQTSTTQTLRNDADSGDIATSTQSDDGTTHTRGEWA